MTSINDENKKAAAWLSWVAYTHPSLDGKHEQTVDIQNRLKCHTSSLANGPFTLVWGPAASDGILIYGANDKNGNLTIACRGTIGFSSKNSFWQDLYDFLANVWDDLDSFSKSEWPYQPSPSVGACVTAGMINAFNVIRKKRAKDHLQGDLITMDDFIQRHAKPQSKIFITGHSLGGALTNLLAVYLAHQYASSELHLKLVPFTFAAPTVSNKKFALNVFSHYIKESWQSVNEHDVIPRAWRDLMQVATAYWTPGHDFPPLMHQDMVLYNIVAPAAIVISSGSYNFTPVNGRCEFPSGIDYSLTWISQAETQHSLVGPYFKHLGLIPPKPSDSPGIPNPAPEDLVVTPLQEKIIDTTSFPAIKLSLVKK